MELCENDKKQVQAIQRMSDSIHLRTLIQFHASSKITYQELAEGICLSLRNKIRDK